MIIIDIKIIKLDESCSFDIIYSKDKRYISPRWICNMLQMTHGQRQNQIKLIQTDPILLNGCKRICLPTKGGNQLVFCLMFNYAPIWLSKINLKSCDNDQIHKINLLINYFISNKLQIKPDVDAEFHWEGKLRDEIFKNGYFDNYKIIDKEVSYDFGRIDLLARNYKNELTVIELKKKNNYNDVIQQCIRYKKGFKNDYGIDVDIVICTLEKNGEFLEEAKKYKFKVYTYERSLKVSLVD